MSILLKFFQQTAEEGAFPNSFHKATITLIKQHKDRTKPDKNNIKKENYRPISLMNRCKKSSTKF